jgi:hypothetical protein
MPTTLDYITRTNTTGGATPASCPDASAPYIRVPFTATYSFYSCDIADSRPVPTYYQSSLRHCGPLAQNGIAPPAGSAVVATFRAAGVRIFTCRDGRVVDPTNLDAKAAAVSEQLWAGAQTYTGAIANWDFARGTEEMSFRVNPQVDPTLVPVASVIEYKGPDVLSWGAWRIDWSTGVEPLLAWVTRTDTVGGATPTQCPRNVEEVEVPYIATFTVYNCPEGEVGP